MSSFWWGQSAFDELTGIVIKNQSKKLQVMNRIYRESYFRIIACWSS
jgi:hypothetical protein